MVVMLRQCCCSFSLGTGTIIIGIIEMVSRPYAGSLNFSGTKCRLYTDVSFSILASPNRFVQVVKAVTSLQDFRLKFYKYLFPPICVTCPPSPHFTLLSLISKIIKTKNINYTRTSFSPFSFISPPLGPDTLSIPSFPTQSIFFPQVERMRSLFFFECPTFILS
jgi:hypothetical protein